MNIVDIKIKEISPVFISKIKLLNIKKTTRKSLVLTIDQSRNPQKYSLDSIDETSFNQLKIGDIKKKIRHSLNFDREKNGITPDVFIKIYGKNNYFVNGTSQHVKNIDLSLDLIQNHIGRYSEYQQHNLTLLFNSNSLEKIKNNPDKFEKWKNKVAEIITSVNKVHYLIAQVCTEKPLLDTNLEDYYVNEFTPPADQAPIDPEDMSDFLLTLFK